MTMHKAREILRLKWGQGLSNRQVGRSVKASPATVSSCLLRAKAAGLSWPLPEAVDDAALEALLYPRKGSRKGRPQPDLKHIYRELKRKGVTLELLWMEYKAAHPERGYQYSQFCELYRNWRKTLNVVMRQDHPAGKRLFVDYAGQTMPLVDPETGEVSEAQVFVATLGASSYTYAEGHRSQELRHWIAGHIQAFEFFKGCTEILVPDNEVRRLVGVDGLDLPPLPCGAKDGLFPAVEFACALESPGLVGVSFLGCGVILYELVANLPVPIGTALGLVRKVKHHQRVND
jgi:hypothetical protein